MDHFENIDREESLKSAVTYLRDTGLQPLCVTPDADGVE